MATHSRVFCYRNNYHIGLLQPHSHILKEHECGLGCSDFARRYLRNLNIDLYSSGYLDVSVPQVPLYTLINPASRITWDINTLTN